MIEVGEAINIISSTKLNLPIVEIPIEKAVGRILKEDIFADTDFPPFNRVMMDGIAVKWDDFENGIREYIIKGTQAAGSEQMSLEEVGTCIEVMTGAVAPAGTDVVIPYEDIEIDDQLQKAHVKLEDISKWKNIHSKGSDKRAGDLLIQQGVKLGTPEIAIAASVGKTKIKVTKNPTVAIISTGNELVEIDTIPLPHQIRRSNVYALTAELMSFGMKSNLFHFNDDRENLEIQLKKVLDEHDVIIMSGGVSKGKFDFVPETLEQLGVTRLFHRIKQKPGKPFWFGASRKNKVVFAFPGNPVSTFLCFHKYFVPWLKQSLGLESVKQSKAILTEDFHLKTGLTYFLQVSTEINAAGHMTATPKVGRGSGDHANLLESDAFLELPGNTFDFKAGEVFKLITFRKG